MGLIFGIVCILGFGIGVGELLAKAKGADSQPSLTAPMIEKILRKHRDKDGEFFFGECAKEIESRLKKIN